MTTPKAARIRLRFRKRDEENFQSGYLRELSASRITVTADRPFRSGTRILVEIPKPEPGFYLEGEVEKSLRVPPTLRKVREPEMVIRILRPEELLAAISPDLAFRPYLITKDQPGAGPGGEGGAGGKGGTEELVSEDGVIVAEAVGGDDESLPDRMFPIRYINEQRFLEAMKHAEQSALLVPTPFPVEIGKEIKVQIEIMGLPQSSAAIRGQVVQHLPASEEHPAGAMAVVFLDSRAAMASLRALSTAWKRHRDGQRWTADLDS